MEEVRKKVEDSRGSQEEGGAEGITHKVEEIVNKE